MPVITPSSASPPLLYESKSTQYVIVSGGSRGLGQAIVADLLAAGHHVATFSRSSTEFVSGLSGQARFHFAAVDAEDMTALHRFVADIHARWGRIDGLVNNAGLAYDGVLALSSEEHISRMLNVNLRAAIILAKECTRLMLLQSSGSVINISSIIAERGFSGLATYAATKAGMIGFTRSLARELGPRGIRVNAIAPGYLETEMSASLDDSQRNQIIRRTPLGRLGTAADVVPLVRFLLADDSRFMTGQVLTVDGGASL